MLVYKDNLGKTAENVIASKAGVAQSTVRLITAYISEARFKVTFKVEVEKMAKSIILRLLDENSTLQRQEELLGALIEAMLES